MTNEMYSRTQRPHRFGFNRRGGLIGGLLICLILVGVIGAISYKFVFDDSDQYQGDLITATAIKGPFDHIVLEQGEIESSSNINVVCEVQSRGMSGVTILWVIDEGAKVSKGDKLVEIDSSELELQLKEKRIRVISAEAAVATAAAQVEQAKIAKQEYLDGVYETERKAILSEKAIAEQELRKATLAFESSERLVAKGLVKSLQLDADKFAVANSQNKLDAADQKLWVLDNLTQKKMLVQYNSDIDAADANLSAAKAELVEEQAELNEIEQQIKNCVMYAPSDGVVVHANRYSSRGGSAEFVVEAGAQVRERQEIIQLPDPNSMQVRCKINESRITLIREGMAARISVDAIPGLTLTGRVKKVNRYAEPSSFFSSSIKEYATLVEIINPPESIRTGMTAEVQIFVEQLDEALQVPIQSLYEHGSDMYVLIKEEPAKFRTNKVQIGATNDTMASIDEGLEENDVVILNLRDHLSLMDLPEIEREDNSDMRDVAAEAPKGQSNGSEDRPGGPGGWQGGGAGGPGGGGPGGGGPGAGGPGGGGRPDVNMIVSRIFESSDTDGDGAISAEEMQSMEGQRGAMLQSADSDGDGKITRAEVMRAMRQRMSAGGGPGGGGPGGGGPGGGGPGGGGFGGGDRE